VHKGFLDCWFVPRFKELQIDALQTYNNVVILKLFTSFCFKRKKNSVADKGRKEKELTCAENKVLDHYLLYLKDILKY
jgi:hypothetical protein